MYTSGHNLLEGLVSYIVKKYQKKNKNQPNNKQRIKQGKNKK